MSDNGRSDLAEETTAGAYADSASGHENAMWSMPSTPTSDTWQRNELHLSLGLRQSHLNPDPPHHRLTPLPTPSDNLPLPTQPKLELQLTTESGLTLQVPEALIVGDVDSARMAPGAATGGEEEARPEEPPATAGRLAPASPVSPSDLGFCTQCHGPREYCHGHESPVATPVPAPVTPIPVPAPTTRTGTMAHFRLTREEAMSLADNIANTLEVRRQDSPEVLPPYPEDRQVAEGMGLRRGRGQRGRPRQPIAVHYTVPPAHPRHANRGAQSSRRPLSPAVQGYENNQGTSYIPFSILDTTGRLVSCQIHQGPYDRQPLRRGMDDHGRTHPSGGDPCSRQFTTKRADTGHWSG
jgi:hypothetical protein